MCCSNQSSCRWTIIWYVRYERDVSSILMNKIKLLLSHKSSRHSYPNGQDPNLTIHNSCFSLAERYSRLGNEVSRSFGVTNSRWIPREREYLHAESLPLLREACSEANDHQSAFRKLVHLLIRTCPRTHRRSAEWAGSHVVCSCSPFWRFLGESSRKLSRPKTLRHTVTQRRPRSCMTYVTVSESPAHLWSVAFIDRTTEFPNWITDILRYRLNFRLVCVCMCVCPNFGWN